MKNNNTAPMKPWHLPVPIALEFPHLQEQAFSGHYSESLSPCKPFEWINFLKLIIYYHLIATTHQMIFYIIPF